MSWPGRVSRHDVVYLSPPSDPMQGMPIGNGDVGVLCWCEDSKIILAINKCDLWDYAEFGRFNNWKLEEEERSTTLRHAARIIIDFKLRVFDTFYLSDFHGRISLADACVSMDASGPFGGVSFSAFVGHDDGVIRCEISSSIIEDVPVEVTLERYGSRTFSHWYASVNRDATHGIGGTESLFDGDGVYISQQLSSGTFAVGCCADGDVSHEFHHTREHSHSVTIRVDGGSSKEFVMLAAVTSPSDGDSVRSVKDKLSASREAGIPYSFENHKEAWKAFWNRSLMEYGDDYLDNLWHLTMYYANSSQKGKYPGRFINGLWGWNRDVQPWNFYFHWNQQEVYWPLNAAGHHDLVSSYLDYRWNSLPHAQADARELLGSDGAFVSDVTEARGYNSLNELVNHTPVAQIAMDFWRQYKFTGDLEFLKSRALPYIRQAAYFFESLFIKCEDGKYHAKEGTGYEGWIKLRDCISELVYAKALFSAALEGLETLKIDEPRSIKWTEIIDNLAPLPVINLDSDCCYDEQGIARYARGTFKGDITFSDKTLAAGFGIEENSWLSSKVPSDESGMDLSGIIRMLEQHNDGAQNTVARDMKSYDGIFPFVEYSAVFPSGLISLFHKDTELFNAAANTAKLYAPDCMGWDPLPIVLARLGLADELNRILESWPERWQFFCNGFGHYGPMDVQKAESALRFRTNMVGDGSGGKIPFPSWPFRHMGMESMSVLACAMNESLLQSHDGIIRVAPAACETQSAHFTLHAAGGFIVSADIENGKPVWIAVKSLLGERCRIQNPWTVGHLYENGSFEESFEGREMEFTTSAGSLFIIVPEKETVESWNTAVIEYNRNALPKENSSGNASLGLQRMFLN